MAAVLWLRGELWLFRPTEENYKQQYSTNLIPTPSHALYTVALSADEDTTPTDTFRSKPGASNRTNTSSTTSTLS